MKEQAKKFYRYITENELKLPLAAALLAAVCLRLDLLAGIAAGAGLTAMMKRYLLEESGLEEAEGVKLSFRPRGLEAALVLVAAAATAALWFTGLAAEAASAAVSAPMIPWRQGLARAAAMTAGLCPLRFGAALTMARHKAAVRLAADGAEVRTSQGLEILGKAEKLAVAGLEVVTRTGDIVTPQNGARRGGAAAADDLADEAPEAFTMIEGMGIRTVMLAADRLEEHEAAARKAGIGEVIGCEQSGAAAENAALLRRGKEGKLELVLPAAAQAVARNSAGRQNSAGGRSSSGAALVFPPDGLLLVEEAFRAARDCIRRQQRLRLAAAVYDLLFFLAFSGLGLLAASAAAIAANPAAAALCALDPILAPAFLISFQIVCVALPFRRQT